MALEPEKRNKNILIWSMIGGLGIIGVILVVILGKDISRSLNYNKVSQAEEPASTAENTPIAESVKDTSEDIEPNVDSHKSYTQEEMDQIIHSFVNPGVKRYAYSTLTDAEQMVYQEIADGILSYKESMNLSDYSISADDLYKIYLCVLDDYPEIFWDDWFSYYTSGDTVGGIVLTYQFSQQQTADMIDSMLPVRDQILEETKDLTEYARIMYIFDYLTDHVTYDEDNTSSHRTGNSHNITDTHVANAHNIYGALIYHRAVCEGYAKAFQYLLNASGTECLLISGDVENGSHAWNYVYLDGNYYAVDITWCDPNHTKEEDDDNLPESYYTNNVRHNYCMVDTETISVDHTVDMPYDTPICNGGKYNYYRYNGYELTSFSPENVSNIIYKSNADQQVPMEIYCSDEDTYEQLLQNLDDHLWDWTASSQFLRPGRTYKKMHEVFKRDQRVLLLYPEYY